MWLNIGKLLSVDIALGSRELVQLLHSTASTATAVCIAVAVDVAAEQSKAKAPLKPELYYSLLYRVIFWHKCSSPFSLIITVKLMLHSPTHSVRRSLWKIQFIQIRFIQIQYMMLDGDQFDYYYFQRLNL